MLSEKYICVLKCVRTPILEETVWESVKLDCGGSVLFQVPRCHSEVPLSTVESEKGAPVGGLC